MIILPLGGDGDALVGAPCIQLLFSRLSAAHAQKDELGMGRGRLVPACCSAQLRLPAEYEYRQRGNAEEAHTQAACRAAARFFWALRAQCEPTWHRPVWVGTLS